MKGEINSNTVRVGDFNTSLTPMDRSTKQKISKETQTLNDIMDQLDLIDIYRTIHPKTMNFTFFSSAQGTFSKIDHILGHKSNLGKFKKIEIISSIFSAVAVSGSCVAQEWQGAESRYPTSKVRSHAVRTYPTSKVRSSGFALLEQP